MSDPILSVQNVTKAVGERQLLSDITFDIGERSLVSLIGPNGAGKSTLVKIIVGLDEQYTGEVRIRLGERVNYIPQQSADDRYQLPLSVYEYLRIGTTPLYSKRTIRADFDSILSHVGVAKSMLHQSFTSLSGGERQRIAIARALLGEPTVLVLDEPLAAVDYASRSGLYELIRHLQQVHHMTVLLVSHDVESLLPLSDQVLCLNRTLHTDCHPSLLSTDEAGKYTGIHHHC